MRILRLALCGLVVCLGACIVGDEGEGEEGEGEDPSGEVLQIEGSLAWCNDHPLAAPDMFFVSLDNVAAYMPSIPDFWGHKSSDQGKCMSKIACQESSWQPHATNGDYRGMYQIDVDYFPMGPVTYYKYWNGGRDAKGDSHIAMWWQSHAGFQYALNRYGSPCAGWNHKLQHGWW
jgi:hypothetical protein